MEGILLQTVEGLGEPPFIGGNDGELWESLQAEREEVCRNILAEGPLRHEDVGGLQESEPSEECVQEIEWRLAEHWKNACAPSVTRRTA